VLNTIITTVALAVMSPSTPTSTPPPPARFVVSDVEINTGPISTHWATFDSEGDQSGEVVIWTDADNHVRLDANFADGLSISSLIDSEGKIVELESDNTAEIVERLAVIGDFLHREPPSGTAEGRELWCYGSVFAAVGCVTGNIFLCVGGSIGIVCNCMPLWEDGYVPPGCG
jgi:hypothetical protein